MNTTIRQRKNGKYQAIISFKVNKSTGQKVYAFNINFQIIKEEFYENRRRNGSILWWKQYW